MGLVKSSLDRIEVEHYHFAVLRRRVLTALLVTAAAAAGGCLATRGANVPAGQVAPDFTLSSHDGQAVSLDSLVARGPAVLVFYRGHW
ncbi:MAG: redoxin domain-containing protein [Myxococcales bacterium]|jgi:cytochrome oxidase Cu insertion factor (SCO1/SenC/PrrC family)|nr:redoxin domain-containing protein [Myxococcales bacterium]